MTLLLVYGEPLPAGSFVPLAATVPPGTALHLIDLYHPLLPRDPRAPWPPRILSSLRLLGMPCTPRNPSRSPRRQRAGSGTGRGPRSRERAEGTPPAGSAPAPHRDRIHRAGSGFPGLEAAVAARAARRDWPRGAGIRLLAGRPGPGGSRGTTVPGSLGRGGPGARGQRGWAAASGPAELLDATGVPC